MLYCQIKANELTVYTDTLSAGWNYMDSCVTFEIQVDSTCKVSWTVTKIKKEYKNTDGKLVLTSHPYDYRTFSACPFSFHSVIEKHKQILDSIFSKWSPIRFKGLTYSSFRHGNDYSWNIPIAVLSAKSLKYSDYNKNYPKIKFSSNALFVEFANESNAYKELVDLFSNYGLELRLNSVEKVFTGKVKDMAFRNELLKENLCSEDRVMWDIGMSYFSLIPIKK